MSRVSKSYFDIFLRVNMYEYYGLFDKLFCFFFVLKRTCKFGMIFFFKTKNEMSKVSIYFELKSRKTITTKIYKPYQTIDNICLFY
jgi:hypothetical protein